MIHSRFIRSLECRITMSGQECRENLRRLEIAVIAEEISGVGRGAIVRFEVFEMGGDDVKERGFDRDMCLLLEVGYLCSFAELVNHLHSLSFICKVLGWLE